MSNLNHEISCKRGLSGGRRAVLGARRTVTATAIAFLVLLMLAGLTGAIAGSGPSSTPATARAGQGKVLLVVIDRIGIDDLSQDNCPNIMNLISRGSMSLMNARTKFDIFGLGNYLVIGAGGRALGGTDTGLAFNSLERLRSAQGGSLPAGDIYTSRTGRRAPSEAALNLYIEEAVRQSDLPQATSKPGLMGQVMRQGGKRVSVLGNADSEIPSSPVDLALPVPAQRLVQPSGIEVASPIQPHASPGAYPLTSFIHREVVSIAMDEAGLVPRGDVSSDLARAPAGSDQVETNFTTLERQAAALMPGSDLLVVDMGQTSRVDEQADFFTDARLAGARRSALRQCDTSLGRLLGNVDLNKDLVVVCTPTPTRKMIADGEILTPLVVAGKGYTGGTLLNSATTRRDQVVSNYDIAPTILNFEGLEVPSEMDGRALTATNAKADLNSLKAFRDQAVSATNSRKAMVRVYVITSMCVIALFFLFLLILPDMVRKHPYFWATAILAVLAGPLVWLAVSAMGAVAQSVLIAVAVCAGVVVALLSLLLRDRGVDEAGATIRGVLLRPAMAISGVTLLLILLDTALGAPLMTFSSFGSDVILGDRYYGIGNLFMGFAIGAAVLFTCIALERRKTGLLSRMGLERPWRFYAFAVVVLGVTVVFIGFPELGANVGGLIAAFAAAAVTVAMLGGKRFTLKRAAVVVVLVIVCVGVIVGVDALMPGTASHAGRAVTRLNNNGAGAIFAQIGRKLAANWSLTFASIWRLLLLFGVVAWLVFNWRFRVLRQVRERFPLLYAGFWGLVVGLIVAWLFNDSGIEAAAGISVFLFVPYFAMLIPWKGRGKRAREVGGA